MPLGKWPGRTWLLLLGGVILIRLSASEPLWVEAFYSNGVYPWLGKGFRLLTSWLPFSLGDLLYTVAALLLLRELVAWVVALSRRSVSWPYAVHKFSSYFRIFLWIYIIFNLLWGLNYNRTGIAGQIGLELGDSTTAGLNTVTAILRDRANTYRPANPAVSFRYARGVAAEAYDRLGKVYPFIDPRPFSLKRSLFGEIGNYLGYSGYYNPFSGEGQVNTTVPGFIVPFVTCHEMAHQVGYAKENEANFVGFLSARLSSDSALLYSAYINMFLYANSELRRLDSAAAAANFAELRPEVQDDINLYRKFLRSYDTPLGEAVDMMYNQYLKLNEQPAGKRAYNQVVIWLMAYYRKEGTL